MSLPTKILECGDDITQRCVGNFSQKIMQVLIPCLLFLAVENVHLAQNEPLKGAQEVLDSNQFKNAVAKELLKQKLSNLEAARHQNSLVTFLRKGGRDPSGLKTVRKSSLHKDDDPSRKQAQMANTFIASSNLLFGTKSQQRKACNNGKPANKEVLDMSSLRQTYSGYNEDGSDFSVSKEEPKQALDKLKNSYPGTLQKRSNPKKVVQDPISCYLTEPKKVTCMHKDIIYKIALPSSEVADDEIGRIVESIYRAVEGKSGGKASLDEAIKADSHKMSLEESAEATGKKTSAEDSTKKKRASEDYLRSLFLNNLLVANHKALPDYNGNSPVFIPLLIPMTQPNAPKAPAKYYPGLAIDPRLHIPMNLSVGVDPVSNLQTGRNMLENSYGRYWVSDNLALPELNLKPRSQENLTAEEEKRRNWLALMATNGLVQVENGVNPKVLSQHSANGEAQSFAEEKDSISSGNKLTVAETGEMLDNLLNKRQQRDTYFIRRQLRKKPIVEEKPTLTQFNGNGKKHILTKVVQKLSDPEGYLLEEKKGFPCPCPSSSDLCTSSYGPRKHMKSNLFKGDKYCSSTIKCPTITCSTCPEGCQPIPSCPCSPSKACSTKPDISGDSDIILSRVVSRDMTGKEEPPANGRLTQPVRTSHQNWLPYSPQLIPQNKPQNIAPSNRALLNQPEAPNIQDYQLPYYAGGARGNQQNQSQNAESHQTVLSQPASSNIQENQPSYYTSGSKGSQVLYSVSAKSKPFQNLEASEDDRILSSQYNKSNEVDSLELNNQPKDENSGPFEQDQQYPQQVNSVRKKIQENQKQLSSDQGTNIDGSGHDVSEGAARDTAFLMTSKYTQNSQADHNNSPSKQNDAKSKKHRDSFFARLRSKFHKGIQSNGTDFNQYSNQNQHVQSKAVIGTSIFKFNNRNQTGTGKDNSSTTNQVPENQQQCLENQTNQSKDQMLTLTNQTQPSTINNINITIASSHPQAVAEGIQTKNQINHLPQPSKNDNQCYNGATPTTRVVNGRNGRTCKATKIWLCPPRSTNITAYSECSSTDPSPPTTTTNPNMCQTNLSTPCEPAQSTTCRTTQPTTCQTTQTTGETTTCKTSTARCPSATSCMCLPIQSSACSESWNLIYSLNPLRVTSDNIQTEDATQSSPGSAETMQSNYCAETQQSTGAETSTPICNTNFPPVSLPQPENPWSPGDPQTPPGMPQPLPPPETGSPGAKLKTFFTYGPYAVRNQWQYPNDRLNSHPSEQNFKWQQQTRVPLPQYAPQVPQPKQPLQDSKIPPPTPQAPHQKQVEHTPVPPLRRQEVHWHQIPQQQMIGPKWQQNIPQAQEVGPTWQQAPGGQLDPRWQQAPGRRLESDPTWQSPQPGFPNRGGQNQPVGTEYQYRQEVNLSPYDQNTWSKANRTMVSDRMNGMRNAHLPVSIKQHIARVRRYLEKKRSKMSLRP